MNLSLSVWEICLLAFFIIALMVTIHRVGGLREPRLLLIGVFLLTLSKMYYLLVSDGIGYLIYVPMTVGYLMVGFFTVKIILDLGELNSIRRIAFHDPLTGAYNRAFIEEYVEEELRKARRLNEEFCIMLADLNDFKRVNDRYGHDAGDSVLKRVVRELKRHLRDYDLVARWGGDEFLIVLPSEKEADVLEVVGRLVSDFVVNYEDTEVTLSVGYACFPRDGMSLRELVRRADHRMYRSKSLFKEAKRHAVDDKGSEEV